MRTNLKEKIPAKRTHGGGVADRQSAIDELVRTVSTCLLFEDAFYEKGSAIAKRMEELCAKVDPEDIARLAILAREDLKLRHVPLFLLVQMVKRTDEFDNSALVGRVIARVVQRPDEMGELLSLYWGNERHPISAQLKKGLARAFGKFSEYQLSKWNRDAKISLKDVMFLVHPKPSDHKQDLLFKRLLNDELEAADTWERALSAGKDKKATWERLLRNGDLGYMALLMNLRNMLQVDVDRNLIRKALLDGAPRSRALPFRFISAAKAAPDLEGVLGEAMEASLSNLSRLDGRTLYLVDVSGSMQQTISGRGMLDRIDAASSLAMLLREVSEDVTIYATAGSDHAQVHATAKVPPRHTFALRDAIHEKLHSLGGGGIFAYQALKFIESNESTKFDRVVILTDEQDCDHNPSQTLAHSPRLAPKQYIINVAPYEAGLKIDSDWVRISGWSERIVDWIQMYESGVTKSLDFDLNSLLVETKPRTQHTAQRATKAKPTKRVVKYATKKATQKATKKTVKRKTAKR